MPAIQKPSKSIEIKIPAAGYRRSIWCNAFRVQWVDGNALVVFGFISNVVVDHIAVLIPLHTLNMSKSSFLKFADGLGSFESEIFQEWTNPTSGPVEVVDSVVLSAGDVCEITLLNFSLRGASSGKDGTVPTASGVAVVRCQKEFLRHLVNRLYQTTKP